MNASNECNVQNVTHVFVVRAARRASAVAPADGSVFSVLFRGVDGAVFGFVVALWQWQQAANGAM